MVIVTPEEVGYSECHFKLTLPGRCLTYRRYVKKETRMIYFSSLTLFFPPCNPVARGPETEISTFQPSGKETIYHRPRAATVGHMVCHPKRNKEKFFFFLSNPFVHIFCKRGVTWCNGGGKRKPASSWWRRKKARHRDVSPDLQRASVARVAQPSQERTNGESVGNELTVKFNGVEREKRWCGEYHQVQSQADC